MADKAKRKRSGLWLYFEQGDGEAICSNCNKRLKTPTGTTTTLKSHLSRHHVTVYEEYLKSLANPEPESVLPTSTITLKQQTVSHFFQEKQHLPSQGKEAKAISDKIARMLALCHLPYTFVEENGFKDLMKHLKPNYKIPVSTTFSRNIIPELYKTEHKKLEDMLHKDLCLDDDTQATCCQSLALTTDNWSSRAGAGYMSLTCHYLTKCFQYKSFILGNTVMKDSHTGENLRHVLSDMCQSWHIPPPMQDSNIKIYIVTDNASNLHAAISGTQWNQRQCFAHTLQLAIHDAKSSTPNVTCLISKSRAIVGHYNRSNASTMRLKTLQETMNLPPLKLIQDVETRWCSEFMMLERLISLKEAIAAELTASNSDIECLSSSQWKLAVGVVEVLKPFAEATQESSGNSYPTSSMIIPMIHCLEASTNNHIRRNENGTGIPFARNLVKSLKSRFPLYKMDTVNVLSTFTDPRYKLAVFSENEKDHAITLVKNEISRLMNVTRTLCIEKVSPQPTEPTSSAVSLWDELDKLPLTSHKTTTDDIEKEILEYLSAARLPRTTNPFEWWEKNKDHYPHLAAVARYYLHIPATQVASERVFSTAGNIPSHRSS